MELVRLAGVVKEHEIVDAVAGFRCRPGTQGKSVATEERGNEKGGCTHGRSLRGCVFSGP